MSDRVVLLTGASGGLGRDLARALAANGYRLALHYFHHQDLALNLEAELNKSEKRHSSYHADLCNENAIAAMVEKISVDFGKIDIIINNAGVSFSGMSWKQSLEDWNHVLSVNLTAPFLLSKYSIPHLRKNSHGRIINISSVVAKRALAGTSAYAASKAALEGLSRAQAMELSKFGITVNCISPGYFDAGMITTVDEKNQELLLSQIPLERFGKPAELAQCVLYLCNEASDYMTGQVLQLNGGLYF
jgi:3-oxoacyl-[acyl-carrier protein] reductase